MQGRRRKRSQMAGHFNISSRHRPTGFGLGTCTPDVRKIVSFCLLFFLYPHSLLNYIHLLTSTDLPDSSLITRTIYVQYRSVTQYALLMYPSCGCDCVDCGLFVSGFHHLGRTNALTCIVVAFDFLTCELAGDSLKAPSHT